MGVEKKSLIKFNIKNAKYAVKTGDNYASPVAFGTSRNISLEPVFNTKEIYGDGEIIAEMASDLGKKGKLGVNNIDNAYEIAMERKKEIADGLADISVRRLVKHAIYFETYELQADEKVTIAKTWLLNVTSSRPTESYEQTTDNINESTFEYDLTIRGDILKDSQGTSDYKDANGMTYRVYQLTKVPTDDGYDTFENTVPVPKAKGE